MTTQLLVDLFDHMEWADARVWQAALKHEVARTDGPLRALLLHTHAVQKAFFGAWTNQDWAFPSSFDDTTLEGELASTRGYYARAGAFVASLDEQRLAARIKLPWTHYVEQHLGRPAGALTLGESVLQVLMHSAHHRAQANMRLRALGAEPQLIDYIGWLWLERPQPEWPAVATS